MSTFDEFYLLMPNKKAEDRGVRGKYFEQIFVPWFLKNDPEWSSKITKVWKWKDYPDRWGPDCGIDLVYEDNERKRWAVQCKCISPDREIPKSEIDSFLSESNDSSIFGRLLIATTDGIGRNARQVIQRQEKQVVCFLRSHFQKSEVDFPSSLDDLCTGSRKLRRIPRDHQSEAIMNVVDGLKHADKGQLLMACGTGKTLTSLWIKEALGAGRALVLVPSLGLLSQTLREWTLSSQKNLNWICVCSDKSVAVRGGSDDAWIERVSELGVPVTSKPDEIRKFILDNDDGVVFSTYQSSPLVEAVQISKDIPAFDITFADEAHRCAGTARESNAFSSVLDEGKIRSKKRLFMTATQRVISDRVKKTALSKDIEYASMNDSEIFGKVLYQLPFSAAIKRGLLTDYRVVIVGVDDPIIESKIINRELTSIGNDYETLAQHLSLYKAMDEYGLCRVITFHNRIKNAKMFSQQHACVLDLILSNDKNDPCVEAHYISGEMTAYQRNERISRLRTIDPGQKVILANARCLSEGVDVPALDAVAFIDPRGSHLDIVQSVGRAIRKSPSKSFGYILLPVYLGDTSSLEQKILESRFAGIWRVLLALKSQDDGFADCLDSARIELGRRGSIGKNIQSINKVLIDLPSKVEESFEESLKTILVENLTDNWDEMYGKLLAYVDQNSDSNPPVSSELGMWCSLQKSYFSNGKVLASGARIYNGQIFSTRRINLLSEVRGWSWLTLYDRLFMTKYNKLRAYVIIYGHARPSKKHDAELSSWTSIRRKVFNNGKDDGSGRLKLQNNILTKEQIGMLEALPGWEWDLNAFEWNNKCSLLESFVRLKGHASPQKTEPVIGKWVANLRYCYNNGVHKADGSVVHDKSRKALTKEQIKYFESLPGWKWRLN